MLLNFFKNITSKDNFKSNLQKILIFHLILIKATAILLHLQQDIMIIVKAQKLETIKAILWNNV
jgi:hypothetical protein